MKAEERVEFLLCQAKKIACEYYSLTKKPLGVTGEIAEYEASKKLGLNLEIARTPFYDAWVEKDGRKVRYQIKGRAVDKSNLRRGHVGSIKLNGDFDAVLLVLLDKETLNAIEIWEASKTSIETRIAGLTGTAATKRNSISISQFVSQATVGVTKVWSDT